MTVHTIAIADDLPPDTKAAYTSFNQVIAFTDNYPRESMPNSSLQELWSSIKYPEFIWELVNEVYDRWVTTRDLMAHAFLQDTVAVLWQHGVRDNTDTLTMQASEFLAGLA